MSATNFRTLSNAARSIAGVANSIGSFMADSGSAWVNSVRPGALATTQVVWASLFNTTPALVGTAVQNTPIFSLGGAAWDTDDAVSRFSEWGVYGVPGSAATITSTLTFVHRIGAAAWVTAGTLANNGVFSTGMFAANYGVGYFVGASLGGTGITATHVHLKVPSGSDYPLGLFNAGRTDAASNVVHFHAYLRSATSITNGATMRDLLVSWTDNSVVNRQLIAGYYDGSLWLAAGGSALPGVHYGAGLTFGNWSEEKTLGSGDTTHTTTAQIPAEAVVLYVSTKVTVASANAVTYDVGVAGATARYGTGLNAQSTGTSSKGTMAGPLYYASAVSVTLTTSGVPGATGKIRVVAHYYTSTAPTS